MTGDIERLRQAITWLQHHTQPTKSAERDTVEQTWTALKAELDRLARTARHLR